MRQYDEALVECMCAQQYYADEQGLELLVKPVPDVPERDVFDPRIVKRLAVKQEVLAARAGKGHRLSFERNRPDKVTHDLTERPVMCDEVLVPVNGDHYIDVYVYRPSDQREASSLLVYAHGGGFTAGDERLFHNQMMFLAERSGGVVVFPEYRLAPECPFPGAIEDVAAVVAWAHDHAGELGASPDKIALGGDSAGGSLACACLLGAVRPYVRQAFLLYAASDKSDYRTQSRYTWNYDAYQIEPEQEELMRSRVEKIKRGVENDPEGAKSLYLQGRVTPRDPRVSAVFATDEQLAQFPPTVVISAEYDYLRLGNEYLARRLLACGVDVTAVRYRGCDHGFLDYFGWCPQAEDVCLMIAEALAAW